MKSLLVVFTAVCSFALIFSVIPSHTDTVSKPESSGIAESHRFGAQSLARWHSSYFHPGGPSSVPRPLTRESFQKFGGTVRRAALKHQIDPALIWSIMVAESGLKENAISPRGAMGLMQLMPLTAQEVGVKDVFNPHQNIAGGVRYFRMMLDRFDKDVRLALAAYNAGPGNVEKYNGIPPYPETKRYIHRVLGTYEALTSRQSQNNAV